MKAIIIAAGKGYRLNPLTDDSPKCLLPMGNETLLERTMNNLHRHGIDQISIVRGYKAEKFTNKDVRYYLNDEYEDNNILHSLMKAREEFDDDLIISYSDIWYNDEVVDALLTTPGDIVVSVDTEWKKGYVDRTLHPTSEAENATYDNEGFLKKIGKHLGEDSALGEFLGLMRLTKKGAQIFREEFEKVDESLDMLAPFQKAKEWQKAYLTDFLQHLTNLGHPIRCSLHSDGWFEMDTIQDYAKAIDVLTEHDASNLTFRRTHA